MEEDLKILRTLFRSLCLVKSWTVKDIKQLLRAYNRDLPYEFKVNLEKEGEQYILVRVSDLEVLAYLDMKEKFEVIEL